jgi:putative glutamine amidotransferase
MRAPPRVVATLSVPNGRKSRADAREQYLAALRDAGFEVVAIDARDPVPAEFDALCLTGGEDVEPRRYGADADENTEVPDPERDALELELLRQARDRDLPVLGICRGFQVINVAYGGSLVQHVLGHRRANGPVVAHSAAPAAGSNLAAACGTEAHAVNSSHHQVVTDDTLGPGLVPTVRIDGLIEAFEDPAHRWLVAVQWHPERTSEVSAAATRIFRAFADAASREPARAR